MGIRPATAALLADLREWAADPSAICYPIAGRIVVFPEDIPNKTDEQLIAFIRERLLPP